MTGDKLYISLSANIIVVELTNRIQRNRLITSSTDKYYSLGPYRNLMFHNVLARQGFPFCNRARLKFQAFALRDIKIATREGRRVGQKMS